MVISPVHFPSYQFLPRNKRGDSFFDSSFYFRRGSWALAYGLLTLAKKRGKGRLIVWLPDYFCREPIEILQRFPVTIAFYPITKKFTPDWEALERMANGGVPDVLVLVHYFGFPNDLIGATAFCQKYQIDLVEDCAHVMEPFGAVGTSGALSIWSPWKFFPLPELGILWVRDDMRDCVEILPPSREVLHLLQWWAKREAQRLLCVLGVNWYNSPRLPLTVRGSERGLPASPSALSFRLFHVYLRSCADHIQRRRTENYRALESFFKEKYSKMILFDVLPKGVVPYAFPIITKKPSVEISKELIRRGIPVFSWPTLPEEVQQNKEQYQWAHWYAKHLLLLPIHQNVSVSQITYIKNRLESIW